MQLNNSMNAPCANGIWTPSFSQSGDPPTSATYSVQDGFYSQMGDVFYFSFYIQLTGFVLGSGSGTLRVIGSPINAINIATNSLPFSILFNNLILTNNILLQPSSVSGRINPGSNIFNIFQMYSNAESQQVPLSSLTSSTTVQGAGFYFISQ